jgi:DNA (cytosine-5)-methyltransferase 1
MIRKKLTAIEIFSGGGGLAVGLRDGGFSTVAAVEMNPAAVATFKANHKDVHVYQQDVRTVSGATLLKLAKGKLDILAACPPCQGFSSLTSKWKRSDPRNSLVTEVARLAEEMMPQSLMVENVPGLVDKGKELFDGLIARLEKVGYICNWAILQVADYGVPQKRRRLVLLAGLGFRIEMPVPTHSRTGEHGLPRWRTVRDALAVVTNEPRTLAQMKGLGGPQAINWHVTRTLSPENVERLRHAKAGGVWSSTPEAVRPKCHRGGYEGFTNVYGRMEWDEPSVTITAGCTTLSKGRFGHPDQDRTISLREAALLQTFPMDYHFDTEHFERACEIVGNALPCLFATIVARTVSDTLRSRLAS